MGRISVQAQMDISVNNDFISTILTVGYDEQISRANPKAEEADVAKYRLELFGGESYSC